MKHIVKHSIGLLAGLTLACGAAMAQSSAPTVSLMVPYPAGGLSDVIARLVSPVLAKHLDRTVIVENLGGAGGAIAAQKVLSAPADGNIIYQGSPNELILTPMAVAAVKHKSEDFRPVQSITLNEMILFARKDLPVNNGDELAAYAAKMAKEGKPVTYASVGPGSLYHILGEHMSKVLNVPMTHVPYKGGAPATQDLIGGQIDIFITPYGKAYIDLVATGKIKAVAALSAERQAPFKSVPTLSESKAFKGFVFDTWQTYFVRKDTPEAVVQTLHKALSEVANDAGVRSSLESQGMIVPKPVALDKVSKTYTEETAQYRAIAKAINLQAQ
ncbi:MAG: hypothetical protein RL459_1708 [Pseudomonadota bacterium]|jgi:tripartite-type tricarboxylate transporter receptor subunit TctC